MRLTILLGFALLFAPAAAWASDISGKGFYPPGDNPDYLLTIHGSVSKGRVSVRFAELSAAMLPMTLFLTPQGDKLGMGEGKAGNRLDVTFDIDTTKAPALHPTAAHVTVYYPWKISALPTVNLKGIGVEWNAPAIRDPKEPKLSDLYANIAIPATMSSKFHFGDKLLLTVNDISKVQLERATFAIPSLQAYNAMMADAKKDLIKKSQAGNDDVDVNF